MLKTLVRAASFGRNRRGSLSKDKENAASRAQPVGAGAPKSDAGPSVCAAPAPPALEGYLLKKHHSSRVRQWGKRWVEVDDFRGLLCYYRSQAASSERASPGSFALPLEDIESVQPSDGEGGLCLSVHASGRRTLVLKAPSATKRDEWVNGLALRVARIAGASSGGRSDRSLAPAEPPSPSGRAGPLLDSDGTDADGAHAATAAAPQAASVTTVQVAGPAAHVAPVAGTRGAASCTPPPATAPSPGPSSGDVAAAASPGRFVGVAMALSELTDDGALLDVEELSWDEPHAMPSAVPTRLAGGPEGRAGRPVGRAAEQPGGPDLVDAFVARRRAGQGSAHMQPGTRDSDAEAVVAEAAADASAAPWIIRQREAPSPTGARIAQPTAIAQPAAASPLGSHGSGGARAATAGALASRAAASAPGHSPAGAGGADCGERELPRNAALTLGCVDLPAPHSARARARAEEHDDGAPAELRLEPASELSASAAGAQRLPFSSAAPSAALIGAQMSGRLAAALEDSPPSSHDASPRPSARAASPLARVQPPRAPEASGARAQPPPPHESPTPSPPTERAVEAARRGAPLAPLAPAEAGAARAMDAHFASDDWDASDEEGDDGVDSGMEEEPHRAEGAHGGTEADAPVTMGSGEVALQPHQAGAPPAPGARHIGDGIAADANFASANWDDDDDDDD